MLDLVRILRITPVWHEIVVNSLLAGSYIVLANFTFHSAEFSDNLIAILPASGLALAAIIVFGYRMVIGITIGSLCFNLNYLTNSQVTFPTALASSGIITLGETRKGLIFPLVAPCVGLTLTDYFVAHQFESHVMKKNLFWFSIIFASSAILLIPSKC